MKIIMLLSIVLAFYCTGCATVFKGYESRIEIKNVSDSLKITDEFGKIIQFEKNLFYHYIRDSSGSLIKIRSGSILVRAKEKQELIIYDRKKVYKITHQAKVSLMWFTLDLLLGGFGIILDAYTGNWYTYPELVLE